MGRWPTWPGWWGKVVAVERAPIVHETRDGAGTPHPAWVPPVLGRQA